MIRPAMEIKPFSKCRPGELIRRRYHSSSLELVAQYVDDHSLTTVQLQDEKETGRPRYRLPPTDKDLAQPVISYGQNYTIDVAQDAPFEFGPLDLIERPGVLWLYKSEFLMLAAPPGSQWSAVFFRISDGMLVDRPDDVYGCARFSKWLLSVPGADPSKPTTLFNFELKQQAEQN